MQEIESDQSKDTVDLSPEAPRTPNSAASGTGSDDRQVTYWIGMAPFERHLLEDIAHIWSLDDNSFGRNPDDESLLEYLFNQWDWSYDTQAFLCESFHSPNEKGESREEIYKNTLHQLERLPRFHLRYQFRVDILRKDNGDFLSNLADCHFGNVIFGPRSDDLYHWKILVAMYRDCTTEMEFWTNAMTRRAVYGSTSSSWKTWVLQYEIWKVVRMFDLHKRRPENARRIIDLFTVSKIAAICQTSLRQRVAMVEDGDKRSDCDSESAVIEDDQEPGHLDTPGTGDTTNDTQRFPPPSIQSVFVRKHL
jgi:hypothetical protein